MLIVQLFCTTIILYYVTTCLTEYLQFKLTHAVTRLTDSAHGSDEQQIRQLVISGTVGKASK